MASVLRVTLDTVLLQAQAKLMAAQSWPAERVRVEAPEDVDQHPQAEQYVLLWGGDQRINAGILQGAGRIDCRISARCNATLRTRTALDEVGSGLNWLTHPELGHYFFQAQVLDALLIWLNDDSATSNWNLFQPVQTISLTRPKRLRNERDWGESTVWFDLDYVFAATQQTATGIQT